MIESVALQVAPALTWGHPPPPVSPIRRVVVAGGDVADSGLAALPNASRERRWVAMALKDRASIIEEPALSDMPSLIETADVFHFAGHALSNPEFPLLSRLLIGGGDNGGWLQSRVRGLLAFAPDRSAKSMRVMFVKQGGHKTVVVADPGAVGASGTALSARDAAAMKFDRTWRSVPTTLEKWEGTISSLTLTPSGSPLELKPLNLFPLTQLSGTSSLLAGAALNAKIDSAITIRSGSFGGLSIVAPTNT